MAREIDKNDVDISQLFKWKKEVKLSDAVGGISATVYLRLIGDADINRARAYGYRKSGEMRKKLKDKNSPERVSLLAEIDEFDSKEVLVNTVLLLKVNDIYTQATKETKLKEPVEPDSEDSQELWEEYQRQVDEYPEKFKELVVKRAEELQEEEEKRLSKLTKEQLHGMYIGEIINRVCMEEMQICYYDMCIYLGCYKDPEYTTKAFGSFESYDNSHAQVKTRLRKAYQDLELGLDFLKKLPEATE